MIPGKVTWVCFSSRISAVYSKLLLINDFVSQFLMENLHIWYNFSHSLSVFSYSEVKEHHIYDINSLIFVQLSCIDSIYANLCGLVV